MVVCAKVPEGREQNNSTNAIAEGQEDQQSDDMQRDRKEVEWHLPPGYRTTIGNKFRGEFNKTFTSVIYKCSYCFIA